MNDEVSIESKNDMTNENVVDDENDFNNQCENIGDDDCIIPINFTLFNLNKKPVHKLLLLHKMIQKFCRDI